MVFFDAATQVQIVFAAGLSLAREGHWLSLAWEPQVPLPQVRFQIPNQSCCCNWSQTPSDCFQHGFELLSPQRPHVLAAGVLMWVAQKASMRGRVGLTQVAF